MGNFSVYLLFIPRLFCSTCYSFFSTPLQYMLGRSTTAIPRGSTATEFIEPTQGYDAHQCALIPQEGVPVQTQFDRSQVWLVHTHTHTHTPPPPHTPVHTHMRLWWDVTIQDCSRTFTEAS